MFDMEPAERTRLLLAHTLALLLLPCANAFAPQLVYRLFSRPVMRYRGGAAAAMSEEPFPVISRFVGGTWTNNYMIFSGIGFERQEDRLRTVE